MWFFPYGVISRISINERNIITNDKNNEFNTTYKELSIYRISENHKEICCYFNHKTRILYGNNQVAKFNRDFMAESDNLVEINENLFIYNNQAILLLNDNKPIVYMTKNINLSEQSTKLTEALKQIIELGYFEYLEFSYDYMLNYSPDFLNKVLLDYADGKYEKYNQYLNSEYIKNFVDLALSRDFT